MFRDGASHRYWAVWATATLIGIPAGVVGLLFELGGASRLGSLGLLVVCLLVFLLGVKALDRRLNDRTAEDLTGQRK